MTRSFRWNEEFAQRAGPDRCEDCRDLSAKHVLETYPAWGSELQTYLCGECLRSAVRQLEREERPYRLRSV